MTHTNCKRNKRRQLNELHKHPFPVHPIVLPELIPHNPVSWCYFIYKYIQLTVEINTTTVVYEDGSFLVKAPQDMRILWNEGFFGKGVLSRSDPTWFDRTSKRLGIGEFKNLTNEEITAIRREERKKFKKERAVLEAKQAELKKQGIVDEFVEERLQLKELRDMDINVNTVRETFVREEDSEVVDENGQLKNIEFMELMPEEVLFLKFGLNCVNVFNGGVEMSADDLFHLLSNHKNDDPFVLNYITYHHFRSLGHCVRSGIKFGTNFITYKRGPPFNHAEYAIIVLPNYIHDEAKNEACAKSYTWLSNISRVIGGVRKKLVLSCIDIPEQSEVDLVLQKRDIKKLLELYSVSNIVYRRWVSNKNRD